MPGTSKCRYCDEEITWIKTAKNGKNVPLNMELLSFDNIEPGDILFDSMGIAHRKPHGDEHENFEGRMSHFSTCPKYVGKKEEIAEPNNEECKSVIDVGEDSDDIPF